MSNIHSDPEKFGLTTVGEIDWLLGGYEFDYTTVWRRDADGQFVYGEDSGCSCPSPFEDQGVNDLTPIVSLAEFKAHLDKRQADNAWVYEGSYRAAQIAELLERLHAAGAR